MSDLESIIPIVYGHDYATNSPIGIVKSEKGRVIMKLRENAGITLEDINTTNKVFAPSYVVTKEKNGIVLEVELVAMSLQENHH